jgi:hypothetical protein
MIMDLRETVLVEHGIIIDKARDSSEEICLNRELSGPGRENGERR